MRRLTRDLDEVNPMPLEQVKEGLGQVVLLSGEAGISKSRLLQAANDRLEGQPHFRQEYRCSPYHQNSALHPVIEFLEG